MSSSPFRPSIWAEKLEHLILLLHQPFLVLPSLPHRAPEWLIDYFHAGGPNEQVAVFAFGCKLYHWLTNKELFEWDPDWETDEINLTFRAKYLWQIWQNNKCLFPRWMYELKPFGSMFLTPAGELRDSSFAPSPQSFRREYPVSIPSWAAQCIRQCTQIDPAKRPALSEIISTLMKELWKLPFQMLYFAPTSDKCVACSATHLVLDLDGVLIGEDKPTKRGGNVVFALRGNYSNPRPQLFEFLRECFRRFKTVSLWTAGTKEWLWQFTKFLDAYRVSDGSRAVNEVSTDVFASFCPQAFAQRKPSKSFLFCYSRDQCAQDESGRLSKPLARMWETEDAQKIGMGPHNTIIVDDCAYNAQDNMENLLPAEEYRPCDRARCETMTVLADRIVEKALALFIKQTKMDSIQNNDPVQPAEEQQPAPKVVEGQEIIACTDGVVAAGGVVDADRTSLI